MGEVRIVSPGKTPIYTYPVCKKILFLMGHKCLLYVAEYYLSTTIEILTFNY